MEPSSTLIDYLQNTIDVDNAIDVARNICNILSDDNILEEDKAEMIADKLKREAPSRFHNKELLNRGVVSILWMAVKNEPPPQLQSPRKRRSFQRTQTPPPRIPTRPLEAASQYAAAAAAASSTSPYSFMSSSPTKFNHRAPEFRPSSALRRSHSQSPDIFVTDIDDSQYSISGPADILSNVFGCTLEQSNKALELNNYDWELTLNYLLDDTKRSGIESISISTSPPLISSSPSKNSSKPVCRYFLEGGCFRSDCKFSHDLPSLVCRYWLQGSCFKGDTCEFRHELDFSYIEDKIGSLTIEGSPPYVQPNQTTTGSNLTNSTIQINENRISSVNSTTNVKIDDEENFPSLSAAKSKSTKGNNNSSMGISGGNKLGKDKSLSSPSSSVSFPITAKSTWNSLSTSIDSNNEIQTNNKTILPSSGKLRPPKMIPRFETGSIAMHKLFHEKRTEILNYGRNRARLIQAATEAYKRGEGIIAKTLTTQAKDLGIKMSTCHREAAYEIFQELNWNFDNFNMDFFIDLNGLLPDEGIEYLEVWLLELEKKQFDDVVYVVTGTGQHTQKESSQGMVSRKVKEWLESWGYPHTEIFTEGDSGGGVFAVEIKHF